MEDRQAAGGVIVGFMEADRTFLRHTIAALAYRATRALENAPASFAGFDGAGRQPVQILAHMGDLFDWALSIAQGQSRWHDSAPLDWPDEQKRFFAALAAFDAYLESDAPVQAPLERLFQGPVADALTHVGQLAMLRRLAGAPTRGENFYVAKIVTGRTGAEQATPAKTF
jgi:hypothetical protein